MPKKIELVHLHNLLINIQKNAKNIGEISDQIKTERYNEVGTGLNDLNDSNESHKNAVLALINDITDSLPITVEETCIRTADGQTFTQRAVINTEDDSLEPEQATFINIAETAETAEQTDPQQVTAESEQPKTTQQKITTQTETPIEQEEEPEAEENNPVVDTTSLWEYSINKPTPAQTDTPASAKKPEQNI